MIHLMHHTGVIMRIIKIKEVLKITGLGRSTMYQLIAISQFPKPIRLGPRAVGWLESEVHQWIAEKINKRNSSLDISYNAASSKKNRICIF